MQFFAFHGDAIFLKIVPSPARGESRMCSHPHAGDATAQKIAEKTREKFNSLNFLPQNHGLCHSCQNLSPSVATTTRRRRDNFQKNRIIIASKISLV